LNRQIQKIQGTKATLLQAYFVLGLALLGMIFSVAHAENYQVTILEGTSQQERGLKFYPEILPFGGDDTITWKNDDSVPHSITSGVGAHPEYSGKFFKTGIILSGESGSAKIKIGENFAFYYFCELHPWLAGKLVVETAPEAQPETANPIVPESQIGSDLPVSGQVHNDFRKTAYDILIYQKDTLVGARHGLFDDSGGFANVLNDFRPGKYTLKITYGLPTQVGITQVEVTEETIPKWIRTDAKWWADGTITDLEFVKAIEYLAKEKVITIQKGQVQSGKVIPSWLKSSAGWWASGQISDVEFAKSLQYLSDNGIIQI
jgi:plastocyanin